jgi:predicted MFS family arabinose efflux permease
MWVFPLSFFAYQFILRLWPGLMMQTIMNQFAIDASGFGLLAAFYYYGYAGMQIPIALLLERFGPRSVIFSFELLSGLGMVLFTSTNHFYWALLGRLLIGVGSAVGFLGVSQVISQWFKKELYTHMVGLSFSIGLLGAVYGGKPLSLLLSHYDWHHVALALSFFSLLIGFGTYLVVRSPSTKDLNPVKLKVTDLKSIIYSPYIWRLAIANLLMVGALEGFADVWGISYLMTAYPYTKANAAFMISLIFVGMLFGGPILASLARRLGDFTVLVLCGTSLSVIFMILLFFLGEQWWAHCVLFLLIGVLCCYQVIVFSAGAKLVSTELLGITIAFLNCINMLGGSFFHTLIGAMMDLFWTGHLNEQGTRIYSLHSYQYALSLIPLSAFLGGLLIRQLGKKLSKTNYSPLTVIRG